MDARAEVVILDLDGEPVAEPPRRFGAVVLTVVICALMVVLGAGLVGAASPPPTTPGGQVAEPTSPAAVTVSGWSGRRSGSG